MRRRDLSLFTKGVEHGSRCKTCIWCDLTERGHAVGLSNAHGGMALVLRPTAVPALLEL